MGPACCAAPCPSVTVTSCEPMVDDLGTLQANLNSNHNFSAFVKEVRSRFYKLANSS